jgi:hypothetical protein
MPIAAALLIALFLVPNPFIAKESMNAEAAYIRIFLIGFCIAFIDTAQSVKGI